MARSNYSSVKKRPVAKSLQEYGRGVAGGLMFSLPLLYTMEVWWAGFITHPYRLLAYVMATFLLLLGYNRYSGLRRGTRLKEDVIESIEEMGIGIFLAALVLFLLGRITLDRPISEIAGVIVVEAMTVAIGVSIGTAQLGAEGKEDKDLEGDSVSQPQQSSNKRARHNGEGNGANKKIHFGGQMVVAFLGAVLFAANLAPTEEIVIVAIENSWLKLMGLAVFSLLIAFLVLHYSDFKGAEKFVRADHPTVILLGTVLTYAIALSSAALILFFFGRFEGVTLFTALAQTVTLGVAATLGASAGRLLLQ